MTFIMTLFMNIMKMTLLVVIYDIMKFSTLFSETPCSGVLPNDLIQQQILLTTLRFILWLQFSNKINLSLMRTAKSSEKKTSTYSTTCKRSEISYFSRTININGGHIIFPNLRIIRGESLFYLNGFV